MDAALASLLGAAVGVIAGAGGVMAYRGSDRRRRPTAPPTPALPSGATAVLDALGAGSLVVDRAEEVIFASPAAHSWGLVRSDHLADEEVIAAVRLVRLDGTVRVLEVESRRLRRAPRRLLSVRVAPLTADLVVIVAEDHTEAARVDDVRRDFVANVSHELKTPVGALSLLAEAVENAAEDPEAVARFAARMQHEATRLTSMVTELIELSRLQSDDMRTHAEPVLVEDVVSDACDFVRTAALAKQIELRPVVDPGLTVHGVREQLVMAVRNLLDNAINYSPERTHVVIAARTGSGSIDGDDVVEISVADQGIGISGSDQARVFERFYRVDPARSRQTGGTGLGLAIVKHVCVNHGGTVSVWSTEGAGSTFTLRLPMQDPDAEFEDDPPDEPIRSSQPVDRTDEDRSTSAPVLRKVVP